MNNFPEMSLEPPEPVEIGICPICGGEIYEGDLCWKKDGEIICERHLGASEADWLKWHLVEAE